MSRRDIYYWKCDRPAAFHGTQTRGEIDMQIEQQLGNALREHFAGSEVQLYATASQGNHLTWAALIDDMKMFVRVENGPERDNHLAVESVVIDAVREAGVPTPIIYGVDATRTHVPFAWQAMERITFPDLNHWFKADTLDHHRIAFDIGAAIARWQSIQPAGFGPFDGGSDVRSPLHGYHKHYEDYFRLRLEQHLAFLVERQFITHDQRTDIDQAVAEHERLRQIERGCLVHKDLALWNILGSQNHIAAFIDFDDTISGDPMDDLSLLACFHDTAFLARAFEGYQSMLPLPNDYQRRFWLHLLRNMIVKAVIRVGAGYFDRTDGFFLIGSGSNGSDLRAFTCARLFKALQCLRENADIGAL